LHEFGVGHELRQKNEIFFAKGTQNEPFGFEFHLAVPGIDRGSCNVDHFRFLFRNANG
jgi:hypothetical protein